MDRSLSGNSCFNETNENKYPTNYFYRYAYKLFVNQDTQSLSSK